MEANFEQRNMAMSREERKLENEANNKLFTKMW